MILVTGATGNIGREVVRQLSERMHRVAAVTRDPVRAHFPAWAKVVQADPSRPETLDEALEGVEALLLSPRAVNGASAPLLQRARDKGVRRVVVLSAITVEYGGGYKAFADEFRAIEEVAKASDLQWTFLRSAPYAANALVWAEQIRGTGSVKAAFAEAAMAPVHERDVASAAVLALTDAVHAGQAYAITGPQLLTQREQVQLIGDAIGHAVAFEEVSPDRARGAMMARGLPADVPDRMLGYLAACLEKPGPVTATLSRLLGRAPLSFLQWAAEHAAAFERPGQ